MPKHNKTDWHRNRFPCRTRKCVSVLGIEVLVILSGGVGNGSFCVRHGNRLPCWTQKCVSVSGMEVSGVHKVRSQLSGGGNWHGHAFLCETQKRVTVSDSDMVVHSITCHQIDGGGHPRLELPACHNQAASAAVHAKLLPPRCCHRRLSYTILHYLTLSYTILQMEKICARGGYQCL